MSADNLNYKHLHYFWVIVKSGGVAKAGEKLHVTPQALSTQIRQLEAAVGDALWRRAGRRLELTETGHLVLEYADRLFSVGEELKDALRGRRDSSMQAPLRIGVADVVPKLLAADVIKPALLGGHARRLVCREGRFSDLLAQLAVHRLDVVISDRPMSAAMNVRGYNHLLVDCGISFLATPALARRLRPGFPRSLDGAPMLMHGDDSALAPRLHHWFDRIGVRPDIVAEFDDTALMKAFGEAGLGFFAVANRVAEMISRQLRAPIIGRTDDVTVQVYAVSCERRLRHPGVVAISEATGADRSA
jgi:LysR family transcriptional activator of nhaA